MEEKLVITIESGRIPRGKIRRKLYHIWFRIWHIWRLGLLAFLYKKIADFFFLLIPEEKKKEILSEIENFEVEIRVKEDKK